MSIDAIKEALPDYAKDLKLNLGSIVRSTELTEQQLWGALVATAAATKSEQLLREVTARTDLPVLHKDFLTTTAHLDRARELGASAVLLTSALLAASTMNRLVDGALARNLTPFVEVRTRGEIDAVRNPAECVIAVNNKEIKARERGSPDLGRSLALLPDLRRTGTPLPVSAGGVGSPAEAAGLLARGYRALLVGTALLRAPAISAWVAELRERMAHPGCRLHREQLRRPLPGSDRSGGNRWLDTGSRPCSRKQVCT